MDFKHIEIKATMVSGETHIINERFPLSSNSEEVIFNIMNKKFLYNEKGEWVNTSLIEKFNYKAFTKRK